MNDGGSTVVVHGTDSPKQSACWVWEAPEDADERVVAREAIAALFAFTAGWFDVVAIEIRVGLYDREIFTEPSPRVLGTSKLVCGEGASGVRVRPMYRAQETKAQVLDESVAVSWVDASLDAARVNDERYEPSMRELYVAGSRVRVPDGAATRFRVNSFHGDVDVTADNGWVTAPAEPAGVRNPVDIRITNLDGTLRLIVEVFWSPWAADTSGSGTIAAPIEMELERLKERGWKPDENPNGR